MSRAQQRRAGYDLGLRAESFAVLLLQAKGYRVLRRRYKCPVGEIDIIAAKDDTVVFIEVKARARMDDALESLTPRMRGRIERAALHYIATLPDSGVSMRFDLIALCPPFYVRHLDNAWRPDS